MKKSQLNAIAYAYAEKKRRENSAEIERLGLGLIFLTQKKYKTMTWFLKARENCSERYEKLILELSARFSHIRDFAERNAAATSVKYSQHSRIAEVARFAAADSVAACERELDRILNHAVRQHCGG